MEEFQYGKFGDLEFLVVFETPWCLHLHTHPHQESRLHVPQSLLLSLKELVPSRDPSHVAECMMRGSLDESYHSLGITRAGGGGGAGRSAHQHVQTVT